MKTTVNINYPEMHGNTNDAIQAEYSSILNKYRVTSPVELTISRGIEFDSIIGEFGANMVKNKRAGFFKYYMTKKAFDKFSKENSLTLNILLD